MQGGRLTKKSIDDILAEHEAAGRLVRFVPALDVDQSEKRDIWMPPGLHKWCYEKNRKQGANYKANARAFLRRFVIGEHIDNVEYMKSWKWDVFEFRVQLEPDKDNTRIFGAFAKQDVFVAIHQKLRSEFGDKSDPKWDRALERVLKEWRALFHTDPVRARPFSLCVSEKFYDAMGGFQ